MKPLADRHADRARRIVANGSEINRNTAASVGTSASLYRDFIDSTRGFTDDEKAELSEAIRNIHDEGITLSLAEAPDGSGRTMAGIGVINTKVVPAGVDAPEAGNGGGTDANSLDGWGANASPAQHVKTGDANLGGAALAEAAAAAGNGSGGGWGGDNGGSDPLATVDSVTAHAETVNDPAELDRLIAAEKAGKGRTGAISALEARKAALATA